MSSRQKSIRPTLFLVVALVATPGCVPTPSTGPKPAQPSTPAPNAPAGQDKATAGPTKVDATPPVEAEASKVWNAYFDNPAAGELAYGGKTLSLKCLCWEVRKEGDGFAVFYPMVQGAGGLSDTDGYFVVYPASRAAEVAGLKQRDAFTVKAKVRKAGGRVVFFDVLP